MAEELKIPYFAWIYDSPHYTIFSKTIESEYVYLFAFDRDQYCSLLKRKRERVYHCPLAVNQRRLNESLGPLPAPSGTPDMHYEHDISFVGSLYENNMFRKIVYLPEYLRGYLEAALNVQQELYGCSLLPELLTPPIVDEIKQYVKMKKNGSRSLIGAGKRHAVSFLMKRDLEKYYLLRKKSVIQRNKFIFYKDVIYFVHAALILNINALIQVEIPGE